MTFQKGDNNYSRVNGVWNKGIPCNQTTREKIQNHHLQHPELFKFWLGKKRSKSDRQKISDGHLGQKPWNKGMHKKELLQHYPNGLGQGMKGKHLSAKHKAILKVKSAVNGNGKILMQKNHIRPTGLETSYVILFANHNIKLKYVGNAKFFIGSKCPDFINKSKKVAIEVRHTNACKYYSRISLEKYANKRIKYFKQHGWKCAVFSEKDLRTPEKIISKIGGMI